MSKVMDYLNHMDQTAGAFQLHLDNPHKAMVSFGLNDSERVLLGDGDVIQIATQLGLPLNFHALHSPEAIGF